MRKKSFNGSQNGSINRTITMASNIKFQNVQRLNTIVGQITQRTNISNGTNNKMGMSSQVLDMIKNRIKSNYDKLYQNYDNNKQVILKKIHEVQTNLSSQNTINKGFQNFIKQKSIYDKTKIQLELKLKKHKKLIDIRDQLRNQTQQNGQLNTIINEKSNLNHNLQQYKQTLDYQTFILNSMKNQRRQIKLFLKQKYDRILLQQQNKKDRIKKLENHNHNKKTILKRIEQTLKKEEMCEIPENLAQQLEKRLSEYQSKNVYENITKHENIINEENRKKQYQNLLKYKQQLNKQKIIKQKQDNKQYQLAYNFFLIKQQQQQKIKKICGVSSISQIANNTLQTDSQNLSIIKKQIQMSIHQINQQNKQIQNQITFLLTAVKQSNNQANNENTQTSNENNQTNNEKNLLNLQQQLIKQQKQLRLLQINSYKKYELMNQWQSIMQLMSSKQVKRQNMLQILKQIIQKQKKINDIKPFIQNNTVDNITNQNNLLNQVNYKKYSKFDQYNQSDCSIINNL